MHVPRDHHRRLVALDPSRELDVAEKALAAPARRRIRRRRVMGPDPSLGPHRGSLAKLVFDACFHQRSIPPRTDREKSVADSQAVAIAGNAELADLADPSRNLFALGTAFVEVMISRAQNHPGDAGQ